MAKEERFRIVRPASWGGVPVDARCTACGIEPAPWREAGACVARCRPIEAPPMGVGPKTKEENMELTRRDLFKFGGVAAAGAATAGMLASCAPSTAGTSETGAAVAEDGLPAFFAQPEPITDIAETKEFDIVVVGAGAAGVPCALAAAEAGAKVALIQKESLAISQGNTCDSLILDSADPEGTGPAGVAAVASWITEQCVWRSHREQVDLWAKNSGEALTWLWEKATEAGCSIQDTTAKWTSTIQTIDGQPVKYFAFDFGPKPYNTGTGMQDLCAYFDGKDGLEIFYSCPAQQLVKDDSGKVVGVIAELDNQYVQFNGAKGVVIATGDYTNDDEMMAYYNPDMANMDRKQQNKTGDGQKMMVWAGARMEPVCGSKVQHDFDAGPGSMADMPFLCVKDDGTRFCNEARSAMAYMGNFLTSAEDTGWYSQIFDSKYMDDCADWPGMLYDPKMMEAYMPEVEGEKEGVYTDLIGTYSADTLEELAEKLGIDSANFVATVERYNELVEKGVDEDMGKEAKWLKSITEPPFYGIHRHIRLSAIVHGVNVNGEMNVLDADGNPIEGLYAIGNCAGNFFGSPDYPMDLPGLSLGRCHTQGYVVGKALAAK